MLAADFYIFLFMGMWSQLLLGIGFTPISTNWLFRGNFTSSYNYSQVLVVSMIYSGLGIIFAYSAWSRIQSWYWNSLWFWTLCLIWLVKENYIFPAIPSQLKVSFRRYRAIECWFEVQLGKLCSGPELVLWILTIQEPPFIAPNCTAGYNSERVHLTIL